ncbi:ATPase [Thermococcus aciditolerans]|uniref:ATPase n=1 Tax=Thermococcus aciditolerans TaxID=2598455 RepID=A0A5C0SM78_9EURY|nr:ATPase [Thermococcus aciditolerans]QEK15430.1 ATPase [Thermococcus aciditolerans]
MIGPVGDDFVKRYRLEYNLDALERVRGDIGEEAYSRLKALVEYRLYGKEFDRSPIDVKIALAFSAGSDSTASLKILRWAGFNVVPVMAKLPQMREPVLLNAMTQGAVFVEIPGYMDEMREQIRKGAPVCGRCHTMVMDAIEDYARKNGIKIVASGDLLSSGLISIHRNGDVVILNLPAFLALDKGEAIATLGRKYALGFGCTLWKSAAKNSPVLKRFGIQRVLRELRARALTPEMAERLIFDILSQ